MVKKTNVGSVAMCIYGQVVSFSMDHPNLKEAFSEGGGIAIGVNHSNRSPIIGNCVYSGGYMLICIVSPFDIPCSGWVLV